jgi:HSP20 family protein
MKNLIRWEPFRSVGRWDPFDELRAMQREMDRVFSRAFGVVSPGEQVSTVWMPSVESYVKEGKLVFRIELPGVEQKDLDVSITDRDLIIQGERKQEKSSKEESYMYQEIAYGSFERRFVLPEGVKTDELKAKFQDGILEITVPAPLVAKARKIEVETMKEDRKPIESESKKAA